MQFAFLTLAGSVIGEGISRQLVARGWSLAVTDIDLDLVHKVAATAGGPPRVEASCSMRPRASKQKSWCIPCSRAMGAISGLVSTAGGMRGLGIPKADFADLTPEVSTRILDINLQSVLHRTHAVLPAMIAAKRGAIVSIAASRGLHGGPQASIYSRPKAAINVFSQSLAQEVRPRAAFGSTQSRRATPRRA